MANSEHSRGSARHFGLGRQLEDRNRPFCKHGSLPGLGVQRRQALCVCARRLAGEGELCFNTCVTGKNNNKLLQLLLTVLSQPEMNYTGIITLLQRQGLFLFFSFLGCSVSLGMVNDCLYRYIQIH